MNLQRFPRYPLTFGPTPTQPLKRLSAHLGGEVGPEYGLPSDGTLQAIRQCARLEGMLTDPVYEGKSMHRMIDKVRLGEFEPGLKVLYAHLGGVPALSAYSGIFREG